MGYYPWVVGKNHLTASLLKSQLLNADVCISDLDNTDTRSPTELLAWQAIGSEFKHFNPKFIAWSALTGLTLPLPIISDQKEIDVWKQRRGSAYEQQFFDKEGKEKVKSWLTSERVQSLVYPGVKEFYSILPAKKFYLTMSILEIVEPFANYFGFDGIFSKQYDKVKFMEKFVQEHNFKRYLVRGDMTFDEEIVDLLVYYKRKGKINSVCSIYKAKNISNISKICDISVPNDQSGLVKILQS